jgi:hypothetical protein
MFDDRRERRRRGGIVIGATINRNTPWQRLVIGLVILSVGILFWLDRSGSIDAMDYVRWWPFALVAMGVAHLLERRWFGAASWFAGAAYFLLPLLGLGHLHLWRIIGVWPLLISAGGVTLIIHAFRGNPNPAFRAVAVMAGNNRTIGSQQFTAGEAVAVMGGCEIDLTAAQIAAKEAVIDVLAFWGGIEIRVPRGWKVVGKVAAILGGYEDRTVAPPEGAPRLIVRGSAIMGGIEVRNPRESAE